ncbi:hypothetical protein J6590_032190 [Homalodisca vitripennis]|nr:hypothetical protein J6590_032190 [Homalodisca vitripennis]
MPDFEAEYPAYSKRKHGTRQQYEQIKKIELDFRRANWIRKHKKAPRIATKKASCLPKNRVSLLPPNMQRKAAAAQSTAGTSGAAQQPPGNQGQGGARPKTKLSAPGTSGLTCRKPTTGTSRQQGAPGTSRGTGVPAGRGTGLRRPGTGDNCREERRPMTAHDVDMDLARGNIAPAGGPPPSRVCPPKQSTCRVGSLFRTYMTLPTTSYSITNNKTSRVVTLFCIHVTLPTISYHKEQELSCCYTILHLYDSAYHKLSQITRPLVSLHYSAPI